MALTNRQFEVLEYIKKFIASKGYSPTVRELAQGLNLKSPSSAQEQIRKLEASGLICVDRNKSRTIELLVQNEYVDQSDEVVKIPLLEENTDTKMKSYILVLKYMLNGYSLKDLYAFKEKDSTYILSSKQTLKNRASIVKRDGKFFFEECAQKDIFGNVISEIKIFR